MANVIWNPLKHQRAPFFCDLPFTGLVGGYGSGKTDWLCHKMLRLCTQNMGLDGGLLCPDLKMFKRDVLPTVQKIAQDNRLNIRFNRQDGFLDIPETETRVWVFHDEDRGQSIRGPNLAFFLINEATLISKEGFEATMGRVRLKGAKVPQIAWSGTPEGFGYVYREFVEKERTDSKVFYGSTRDNPHLHESFVKRLESSYDPVLLQAYMEGKFVNLNGRPCVYGFNRKFHVEQFTGKPERYAIWVSLDFNVNPMAATLWARTTDGSALLWAFDEIKLRSSDTHEMAKTIKDRVGTNVTIYPDPAGNNRSTRGIAVTDMTILRDHGFKDVKFKRRIVSIRDCLNSVNNMFAKNQIKIDPKCRELIADCEQLQLKDNGEIDKSDSDRSHWLDGFKDMVDYEFPVIRPQGSGTIQF